MPDLERSAQAMYDLDDSYTEKWDHQSEDVKDWYRKMAQAALTAPEPEPEPEPRDDQGRIVEPIYRHGEHRGWHHHHFPYEWWSESDPTERGVVVHNSEVQVEMEDEEDGIIVITAHGAEHDEMPWQMDDSPCLDPECPVVKWKVPAE